MTQSSATRLASFVKAYDVRGVVGEQLTPRLPAHLAGRSPVSCSTRTEAGPV